MERLEHLRQRLERFLPPDAIVAAPEELGVYAADETEDLRFLPALVVRPRAKEAVAQVLAACWQAEVPVTPRGGGTGLSGGALPVAGGVVLALDRLDRIVAIDRQNMTATVEAGALTGRVHEAAAEAGLMYGPDPASLGSCTIGGNIAENAGGPRAVKYGVTRDWVLGLEAVLPDGRIIRTGSACRKDVAGYDLTSLLVGSEGTLAVVTEAVLRLEPAPRERRLLLAGFPTLDAGLAGVLAALGAVTPAVCEFLEARALEAAARHLDRPLPLSGASYVLLEVDGPSAEAVEGELAAAGEALEAAGASGVVAAMTPREIEELWRLRRAAGEAVKAISPYRELDCAVPRSRIVELVRGVREIAARYGVDAVCYGHAGDGNIHVNVLQRGLSGGAWRQRLPGLTEEVFRLAVGLGGTITGEHGVGWIHREAMRLRFGEAELELMRRVKEAFDPKGLLNPRKVLPARVGEST